VQHIAEDWTCLKGITDWAAQQELADREKTKNSPPILYNNQQTKKHCFLQDHIFTY